MPILTLKGHKRVPLSLHPVRLENMRIVIATPLYPPDIAPQASYVKELAQRLSTQHQVTIVAYGSYPEEVPGVRIVSVSKRQPKPLRLLAFFWALYREAHNTEVLYAENGPSVELPVGLLARLTRLKLLVHLGDQPAHARASRLEQFMTSRALSVVSDSPLPRPEILPFTPYPEEALRAYESSWQTHLIMLTRIFTHE